VLAVMSDLISVDSIGRAIISKTSNSNPSGSEYFWATTVTHVPFLVTESPSSPSLTRTECTQPMCNFVAAMAAPEGLTAASNFFAQDCYHQLISGRLALSLSTCSTPSTFSHCKPRQMHMTSITASRTSQTIQVSSMLRFVTGFYYIFPLTCNIVSLPTISDGDENMAAPQDA
jgi:hypothetical protein